MRTVASILILICFAAGIATAKDYEMLIKESFGAEWPLTVPEGTLRCVGAGGVLFVAPDNTIYGVNGLGKGMGYPAIDPIWKKRPDGDARMSIGPLIDRGLKLCDE